MLRQPLVRFVQGQRNTNEYLFALGHHSSANAATPPHSAIRAHCEQTHGVLVKQENFSILDSAENLVSLRIIESFYIHKIGPEINESSSAFPRMVT